ncbi:MAG TPA: hypothetical protein VM223_09970 [Planctomycetota bacterium]|nr:hypothetical protein [Planctomycetota bacterium]
MDILQYAPHAGVVIGIWILAQILKATPLGPKLAEWFIFVPFGLGLVLGIPVSFAIGQVAWYNLIINPFLEACIAAALFKVGKTIWEKVAP